MIEKTFATQATGTPRCPELVLDRTTSSFSIVPQSVLFLELLNPSSTPHLNITVTLPLTIILAPIHSTIYTLPSHKPPLAFPIIQI